MHSMDLLAPGGVRMKSLCTALIIPLLMLLLATSQATANPVIVFQDNFNHDTPGAEPVLDPPGEPDGDYIYRNRTDGTIQVRSEVGDITDQPLELHSAGGSPYFKLEAHLDPQLQDCATYVVSFRSMSASALFYVTFELRNPDNRLLAALEYRTGSVMSFNGSANTLPLNWFTNISHEFEMSLDMDVQQVSLAIDGQPVEGFQGMDFYQSAVGLQHLIISGTGAYKMVVDDIMMTGERCPSVTVEMPAWSSIKARYELRERKD